jgi:hypothetical protein
MFFLAISMVGTDFSMIGQLFPHRARIEIKVKYAYNIYWLERVKKITKVFSFNLIHICSLLCLCLCVTLIFV